MKSAPLNFHKAFEYPFNRPKGMWNILWIFLPIFGWFALGGFGIRIIKEFSKGKFKKLPLFSFKSDMKFGFFMFMKSIPFMLIYGVVTGPLYMINLWFGVIVRIILELFIVPILIINFFNKETIESFFEFRILKSVFDNLGDYVLALLKSFALGIIFFFMIIVLVGLPAGSFTKNIFLADFYRRRVK